MYVLGLDVGTTFTAAAVWRDGRAEISSLGTHTTSIPSVLMLREDEFLVGDSAVRRALSEPTRVAREFKRRFGDSTPVLLGDTPYSVEGLTAKLIRAVVDDVARREGEYPSAVCVSHPANWGPFRIELLRSTLRMVDLQVPVQFVTEPEAAAISFSQDGRLAVGEVVAVYDLGGGTFDAAVLRRTASGFEILGQPEGIERLGGVDVDAAVFRHVTSVLRSRFDDPALLEPDEDDVSWLTAMARLRQECVAAKEALSADADVSIPVFLPGLTTDVRMTRAELESMIRPALQDSVAALRRALRSAGVAAEEVSAVLLVGGSSRIPLVGQLISAELGRPVAVDAHPKHGVALGAAWVASRLTSPEAGAAQVRPPAVASPPAAAPPPVAAPPQPPSGMPPDPPATLAWPPVALPPREPQPAPSPVAPSPAAPAPVAPAPQPVFVAVPAGPPATPERVAPMADGSLPARRSGARRRVLVPVGAVAVALVAALIWQFGRGAAPGDSAAAVAATPSGTPSGTPAAVTARTVIISSDLPLQGSSKPVSETTNAAIEVYLESVGHKAGVHTVTFQKYDDSTAAAGRWDSAQCQKNATAHVGNTNEVAVMGAYNSGCSKIVAPVLNQAADGPMLMVSHSSSNPGLTKTWEAGEPQKFYPKGTRNFARVLAPDDVQGRAASEFLTKDLGVRRAYILNDGDTYGQGLARTFEASAKAAGVTVLGNETWDAEAANYTALFQKVKASGADVVFLGGIFDNNGAQLIKDKVAVLGDNRGVKLMAPDGFTDYPDLTAMPEAQGMYLTVMGMSVDLVRQRNGAGTTKLLDAYRAKHSADASKEALYGVAAVQVILAAIAASDGTRKGVTDAVFGGTALTVPAGTSVLGKDVTIDPKTGDVNLQDVTVEIVKGNAEVPLRAVSLT